MIKRQHIEIDIDCPMTADEVRYQVGDFLRKLHMPFRKVGDDFLIIGLNYNHPERVNFIQTAQAGRFTVNVEIAQFEAPGAPQRPVFDNEAGRYRIIRRFVKRKTALKIFEEVLVNNRIPDADQWDDATEKILKFIRESKEDV